MRRPGFFAIKHVHYSNKNKEHEMNTLTKTPTSRHPAISAKSQEIPPFLVMDVLERAVELAEGGENIIHLEVGEPDFDTPPNIIEAGISALRAGKTHYTPSVGIPELKDAIARHYAGVYNISVDARHVIVTSGSSPAFLLVLAAILDPGDEIILADPSYACYPNFISFLGGKPVFIPVSAADGFQLDPDRVARAITSRTKAVLINSPSNPTGTLLDPDRMKALADLGVTIISDEIYHGLVYEGREHSILEFTDNAFVINGFSKRYAMTGWRLGYIISLPQHIRPMQKMTQNFFISPAAFVQWAGVEALTTPSEHVESMRQTFDKRRKVMLKRLKEMGFGIQVDPTAAFYVLCDARHFSKDSYKFAFEILEETGVGVAPGIDFGVNAEGFIRFSYTNSLENIELGLDRVQLYLKTRFGV
jgi:(5-formylfuran-3-yl)methyl phosphate transaminase